MGSRRQTYVARATVTGPSGGGPSGENKPMLSLLNPNGSGKTLFVLRVMVQAVTTSGSDVIIEYELQRCTSHSGGTAETPIKYSTSDPAAAGEVKSAPTVGGVTKIFSAVIQTNTAQSPADQEWEFGTHKDEEPFTLREDEGFVVHQVESNGGDFAITIVWSEE